MTVGERRTVTGGDHWIMNGVMTLSLTLSISRRTAHPNQINSNGVMGTRTLARFSHYLATE